MELILKGIVTGFLLSIMVGPVFFVLLETSIRKGIKAAIAFDLGVLVNDIFYIAIALMFYNQVQNLQQGEDNSIVRLIGGSIFIGYGLFNFIKKVQGITIETDKTMTRSMRGYFLLGLKGFFLNFANPMVIFYWLSVMSLAAEDTEDGDKGYMILFLATILITFFSIDLLKIIGAKSLRPLVTPRVLKGLNYVIGVVFLAFGAVLMTQGIVGLVK